MSLDGYLLSIDQGTTSSRALILDIQGNIISQKNFEFKQYFPNDGWVEHDPIEILKTTQDAIKFVIGETNISPKDINIAGITNQRETVVAWNKVTGKPVYNAIVWQDRRTENFCETLREKNLTKLIQSKTGLIIDPYFSATKIKWIIENIEEAKKIIHENNVCQNLLRKRSMKIKPSQLLHFLNVLNIDIHLQKNLILEKERCYLYF